MSIKFARVDNSLKRQVIAGMRKAILDGSLEAGQKLIERDLCESFDVSRSLMREVLQQLEAEALITTIPHRGPMVAQLSAEDARSIYAVRQALESLAGAGCAENASDGDLVDLRACVKALTDKGDSMSEQELVEAKNAFYAILLRACGNPIVSEILTGLNNRINLLRRLSMAQPGRLAQTVKELDGIVQAIAERNAPLAARLCGEHVARAAEIALPAFAQTVNKTVPV